jgi:hypothetical protein
MHLCEFIEMLWTEHWMVRPGSALRRLADGQWPMIWLKKFYKRMDSDCGNATNHNGIDELGGSLVTSVQHVTTGYLHTGNSRLWLIDSRWQFIGDIDGIGGDCWTRVLCLAQMCTSCALYTVLPLPCEACGWFSFTFQTRQSRSNSKSEPYTTIIHDGTVCVLRIGLTTAWLFVDRVQRWMLITECKWYLFLVCMHTCVCSPWNKYCATSSSGTDVDLWYEPIEH